MEEFNIDAINTRLNTPVFFQIKNIILEYYYFRILLFYIP